MPDNRCVYCQASPCECADLDTTIHEVATSGATGYVATKYGPMNVAMCQVLASMGAPTSPEEPGNAPSPGSVSPEASNQGGES